MKDILCHPLGPLPWSLATSEGQPLKTNKAALGKSLQKGITVAEHIPWPSATISDGMFLFQKMKYDQMSFGQLTSTLLSPVLNEGSLTGTINIVFGVYREHSIKDMERSTRSVESEMHF